MVIKSGESVDKLVVSTRTSVSSSVGVLFFRTVRSVPKSHELDGHPEVSSCLDRVSGRATLVVARFYFFLSGENSDGGLHFLVHKSLSSSRPPGFSPQVICVRGTKVPFRKVRVATMVGLDRRGVGMCLCPKESRYLVLSLWSVDREL